MNKKILKRNSYLKNNKNPNKKRTHSKSSTKSNYIKIKSISLVSLLDEKNLKHC
jgi:hypothetical protein